MNLLGSPGRAIECLGALLSSDDKRERWIGVGLILIGIINWTAVIVALLEKAK